MKLEQGQHVLCLLNCLITIGANSFGIISGTTGTTEIALGHMKRMILMLIIWKFKIVDYLDFWLRSGRYSINCVFNIFYDLKAQKP
jgi:hypothetical protein